MSKAIRIVKSSHDFSKLRDLMIVTELVPQQWSLVLLGWPENPSNGNNNFTAETQQPLHRPSTFWQKGDLNHLHRKGS